MRIMKVFLGLLMGVLCQYAGANVLLFHADYDTTLNAQIVPPGGSISPDVNDIYSNPIGITSGNKGMGGEEALLVKDYAFNPPIPAEGDKLDYRLDQEYPNTIWFPKHGRATMWFRTYAALPNTIDYIHLFTLHYSYSGHSEGSRSQFGVWLGYAPDLPNGWLRIVSVDPWLDGALKGINSGNIPNGPWNTPGWNKLVVEWQITSTIGTNHDKGTIRAWVNDTEVSGSPWIDFDIGRTETFDLLRIGAGTCNGVYPIGYFNDNTYDEITVEDLTSPSVCGDEGTTYVKGDISGPNGVSDCHVDFYDFAAMAQHWMECSDPVNANCDQYWQ